MRRGIRKGADAMAWRGVVMGITGMVWAVAGVAVAADTGHVAGAIPPSRFADNNAAFLKVDSPLVDAFRKKNAVPSFTPIRIDLPENEILTYNVKVGGFDFGNATLRVNGRRTLDEAPGKPDIYDLAFYMKIKSVFGKITIGLTGQLDAASGFSRYYTLDQKEKKKTLHHTIRYYPPDDTLNLPARYVSTELKETQTIDRFSAVIPSQNSDGAVDMLSVFYYLRGMNLKRGMIRPVVVVSGGKLWLAHVAVVGEYSMDVPGFGKRTVFDVEIRGRFKGVFSRGGKLAIVIDKKTGIPIRFNLDLPVVSGQVTLVRAEHSRLGE